MQRSVNLSKTSPKYTCYTLFDYRYRYVLFITMFIIISFYACQQKHYPDKSKEVEVANPPTPETYKNSQIDVLPDYFFNALWVEKNEDREQDICFYQPSTIIDPSFARYRHQMILNKDNSCQFLYLAPNDAHHMKDASWAYFPPKLYLLEDKVDIIKSFDLLSIKDTLMVVREHNAPINIVYGQWQIVSYADEDISDDNYILNIRGREFDVIQDGEVIHTAEMSLSAWRLQEPLTMSFDPAIADKYPWLNSSPYGVSNDTLTLEIMDGQYSKFVSPKRM